MATYKISIELGEVEDVILTGKAKDAKQNPSDLLAEIAQAAIAATYFNKHVNEALTAELAKVSPAQAYLRLKSFSSVGG